MEQRKRYAHRGYDCSLSTLFFVNRSYATLPKIGNETIKLSPFVSIKSCLVIDVGSM